MWMMPSAAVRVDPVETVAALRHADVRRHGHGMAAVEELQLKRVRAPPRPPRDRSECRRSASVRKSSVRRAQPSITSWLALRCHAQTYPREQNAARCVHNEKYCGQPVNCRKRDACRTFARVLRFTSFEFIRSATNVSFATNANARNVAMSGDSAAEVKPPAGVSGVSVRVAKQARQVSEYVGTRGGLSRAGFVFIFRAGAVWDRDLIVHRPSTVEH